MTFYTIEVKSPLSVEIVLKKLPSKFIFYQNIKMSEDFAWDFTDSNIKKIIKKILNIDGTAKKRLDKNGSIKWVIDLTQYPHVSNRFNFLIPYICKSRRLNNVLYPFQKTGRDWLLQSPSRILADDMGLGKSIQSIAAIEGGIFNKYLDNVFIVCPNTLVTNWESEFKKWCPLLSLSTITNACFSNSSSILNKIKNNNVIITGYSTLEKFTSLLKEKQLGFDLLLADEAHKLRNSTSNINRAFRSIARKKTWLLTGTPLERDEEDIKNILICVDPTSASSSDSSVDDVILKSRLAKISLRRMKRDVLKDLPAVQRITEVLEMHSTQRNYYHSVLKDMQKAPAKERIGFLTKLSYSAIVSEDGSSCKFDRAIEICTTAKKEEKKVIIFSNFNDALRSLRKLLSHHSINSSLLTGEVDKETRNRQISTFKTNKEITILLCNTRIGSEGLNLTEASIVIFLNQWWNPSSNRQAEDRVIRIGQLENVLIFNLISNNTIDDNLTSILNSKVTLEKSFLDQLVAGLG